RSSSTSSGGSPRARRWPTASSPPSNACRSTCRSSSGSTAPTRTWDARSSSRTCPTGCRCSRPCSTPPRPPCRWRGSEAVAMSIFVDENTKVVYQGLTGSQGRFYGLLNRDYGTQVVAGTNPRKAGTDVDGIPVFATVGEAVAETGATASCIFIPAPGVRDAVIEAAEGGVKFIVCITEGVPAHDEAWFYNKLRRDFPDVRLLGPNCPGIISPGKANIGITAGHIAKAPVEGQPNVGIVSRSGTLTYQALYELKLNDIGVTTCVGIGGDPVPGTSFIDCLEAFEADPTTDAVMMFGEIGGSAEEEAAAFIAEKMSKPVVSYIAGVTAPAGKKMGHAGAIVSGGKGTAAAKMDALQAAGVRVGNNPTEASQLMVQVVEELAG